MRSTRNRRTRALALVVLLAWSGPLAGCGYHIRAPHDLSIQTVYVPLIRSTSFRREIQLQLTDLLIKEIEKRTPYKVVGNPEDADTVLEATINFTDKNLVVENPYNLPRQLNVTIQASVRWVHNPPLESEREAAPVIVSETVNFAEEIGESATTAYYRAAQNLATQMVDMMEQPW
ncbi:MAG: hypothetical protein JOZ53_23405 [Planctomycetaceae bacterium]|nr:hypothetical protein [Planctomycetaceae bacterium]